LPEINHAVEVDIIIDGETITVTGEVAQQIGEGRVRCVCMKPTDDSCAVPSCARPVEDYRAVGDAVLGHVFNVIGESLDTDDIGPVEDYWEIHRNAPASTNSSRTPPCSKPASRSSTSSPVRPGWQDRPLRWCGRR